MKKILICVFTMILLLCFRVNAEPYAQNNDSAVLFDANKETTECVKTMDPTELEKMIEESVISSYNENTANKMTIKDGIIIGINKNNNLIYFHLGNDGIIRKCRLSVTYSEVGFIDDGFEFLYDEAWVFDSSINETLWNTAKHLPCEDVMENLELWKNHFREVRGVLYPNGDVATVETAYREGILPFDIGVDENTDPNLTREKFCEFVFNKLKRTDKCDKLIINAPITFDDTDNPRVYSLCAAGIINGTGDREFSPNTHITREETAVIINRLRKQFNIDTERHSIASPVDLDKVSEWAKADVEELFEYGFLVGKGDGVFAPKDLLDRYDGLTLLNRLL